MVDTLHIAKIRQTTGAADFIEGLGFAEAKVGSFCRPAMGFDGFLGLLLPPGPEGVPGVPMCIGTRRKGSGMPSHPRVPG